MIVVSTMVHSPLIKYIVRLSLVLPIVSVPVLGVDSLVTVSRLVIDEKQNGIYIYAITSQPVDKSHLSGWITENNWAYITIYKAQSDTSFITRTYKTGPVREVEASNTGESTQLALKLKKQVSTIEYFTGINPPSISITFGYPEGAFAVVEKFQATRQQAGATGEQRPFMPWYPPLKKSLYLAGTVMSVAGILSSDGSNSGSKELITGLVLLGGTYLFDTWFMPKIRAENSERNNP